MKQNTIYCKISLKAICIQSILFWVPFLCESVFWHVYFVGIVLFLVVWIFFFNLFSILSFFKTLCWRVIPCCGTPPHPLFLFDLSFALLFIFWIYYNLFIKLKLFIQSSLNAFFISFSTLNSKCFTGLQLINKNNNFYSKLVLISGEWTKKKQNKMGLGNFWCEDSLIQKKQNILYHRDTRDCF